MWLSKRVRPRSSFVECLRAKGAGVAEDQRLVEAERERVVGEAIAWKCGAAQAAGVGIVERVAIVEVVDRRGSVARGVEVDAAGGFVVVDGAREGARGELIHTDVRHRNELQHAGWRGSQGTRGNLAVVKDLRERLALRDLIAEALAQDLREVGSVDFSGGCGG